MEHGCVNCYYVNVDGAKEPCTDCSIMGCGVVNYWRPKNKKKEGKMKNKNHQNVTLPGGGLFDFDVHISDVVVTKHAKSGHAAETYLITEDDAGIPICTCNRFVEKGDCKHVQYIRYHRLFPGKSTPSLSTPKKEIKTEPKPDECGWYDINTFIKGIPYMFRVASKENAIRVFKNNAFDSTYDIYGDAHNLKCTCLGFTHHGHCKHIDFVNNNGVLKYYKPEQVLEYKEPIDINAEDETVLQTKNASIKIKGKFTLSINEDGGVVVTLK